jgi:streptomycin 6-kinase
VLKVIRNSADEWRSAEILDAFQENGLSESMTTSKARCLIERLNPGHSLASIAVSGVDDDATGVLAATINAMWLLHGDLHHGNVLFDAKRGWVLTYNLV